MKSAYAFGAAQVNVQRTLRRTADHRYYYRGREVPGVTRVLEAEGLVDWSHVPSRTLQRAQRRGAYVHEACRFLDEGRLDWESLDYRIKGYVLGWQKFKDESGIRITAVERQLYRDGYAGTLDRTGILRRRRTLIDIKTGTVQPAVAVQLAAYEHLTGKPHLRYAVLLIKDGDYRLEGPYLDPTDLAAFFAALNLYNWRTSHHVFRGRT